jgi:hypothetical protein
MSESADRPPSVIHLPDAGEPLRRAIRRMRWFRRCFRDHIDEMTAQTGIIYELDEEALAHVFVTWLRRVEAQRPEDPALRRAYFDFSGALLLCEMLRTPPVRVARLPDGADRSAPEIYWPEGFACTVFCLNVRAAVMAQEYGEAASVAGEIHDIRYWWTFLENVRTDSARAIGFYDILVGNEPDWCFPTLFRGRLAIAASARRPELSA